MAKRKKIGHWFYRFSVEDAKRTAGFVLIVAFIICLLLSLASCGVSKKSRSSSRSSVDSSATTSKVSEGKSQESATVDKSKDSSWESEVFIEFDPERGYIVNNSGEFDTGRYNQIVVERAEELAGPKGTRNQGTPPSTGKVHKVKVNGKTIESTVPIKSATIRENGQTRQLDITQITRQDSGRQEDKATVNMMRKEQAKDRRSISWRIPWWVYLLVIGGAVAGWRLGWFKRDPMDDFEVKYKRGGKHGNITDQS